MIQIDTGSAIIARYDNVVPPHVCNKIIKYILKEMREKKVAANGLLPWQNNDSFDFLRVKDKEVRAEIDLYRFTLTQLVSKKYDQIVYPHFSDLVVWRKGVKMDFHKDDGYEGPNENVFRMRKYSTILYLNDDYLGGETVIHQANKPDYISTPKQGSVVIFKSNDECEHGVNEILEGTRYTIASWFSLDINDCEVVDKY
jgi:hypothetical protein